MRENIEGKKEVIKTIIDFIQIDFSYLPPSERTAWKDQLIPMVLKVYQNKWKDFISFRDEWKQAIEWIVDRRENVWFMTFPVNHTFSWGGNEDAPLVHAITSNLAKERTARVYETINTGQDIQTLDRGNLTIPLSWEIFTDAISDFPRFSLRRCNNRDCGTIFFNPSKRKKIYCSTTCRQYAATKRFREKHKTGI
jgi:hypothetical protein